VEGYEMIYEPVVHEGYEWINTIEPSDYEVFSSFDGSRRAAEWKPVRVRRVRADEGQPGLASDFPWLGSHALIMRRRAQEALRRMLETHGELLPLATADGVDLVVLNVTTVLDALDEERASIQRFRNSQRIMRIKKVAFQPGLVRGIDVFRLPHRMSATYVSRRFVEASNAAGLVGVDFQPVWSEAS
jgi:hypothetical protein